MFETNKAISDASPSVTLTVGQLREIIRAEISMALAETRHTSAGLSQDAVTSNKPYLSVSEAAELARVGPSTIRLYIRKGKLKRQKVGRRVIVSRAELERFLGSQSSKVVELYPS